MLASQDHLFDPDTGDNRRRGQVPAEIRALRILIVMDPDVWRASETLATELLAKKTPSGRTAKAIVEPIGRPGRATE
jgi:hypothetical protein